LQTEISGLLRALVTADVRFVVVGGFAILLQGSAYTTLDLDIAFEPTRENARRIAVALGPYHPRPREYPEDAPFIFDTQSIFASEILTLTTDVGDIDLMARILGVGAFAEVNAAAESFEYEGLQFRVLSVDGLIASKRAADAKKIAPVLSNYKP